MAVRGYDEAKVALALRDGRPTLSAVTSPLRLIGSIQTLILAALVG